MPTAPAASTISPAWTAVPSTQPDADGAGAVEQDRARPGVAADGERPDLPVPVSGAPARRDQSKTRQVGHRRVDPHAVDGVARHQPGAGWPAGVLVGLGGKPARRGGGEEPLGGGVTAARRRAG